MVVDKPYWPSTQNYVTTEWFVKKNRRLVSETPPVLYLYLSHSEFFLLKEITCGGYVCSLFDNLM